MGAQRPNNVAKSMACRDRILTLCSVMLRGMAKRTGAMHVAKVSKKYVTKAGVSRESVAYLLRRTYRDGVTVRHETLANLSALPQATLEAVRVSLTGQALVVPGQDLEVTGSRPHGHVAAVHAQAKALGLPALLGPAVRVFPGNTADPSAFTTIVEAVKDTFKLKDMVMVGDRGMITSARVQELRDLGGFGWVTALRAPAIAALAADDGPLQMSLFDQVNLAEISHPDYPGERLIACRNPALATERARKRLSLLEATDTELAKIAAAVYAGRLTGAGKIGVRVGKVVGRYKMAKHYTLDITDDRFAFTRDEDQIAAEAALDGLYVIRTTVTAEQMDPAKVVATYKSLARVERDFRSIKSIDLDLRPIHHYTETRVRSHVFICMLASYLVWHLRQTWASLTFTDEHRPDPLDPVAPAQRSQGADHKLSLIH